MGHASEASELAGSESDRLRELPYVPAAPSTALQCLDSYYTAKLISNSGCLPHARKGACGQPVIIRAKPIIPTTADRASLYSYVVVSLTIQKHAATASKTPRDAAVMF